WQILDYNAGGGDLSQSFYETNANLGLRFKERQEPFLTLGYHHAWNPEVHTLFLAGRLVDNYAVKDPQSLLLIDLTSQGKITAVRLINAVQEATVAEEVYSTELQQIWQRGDHATVVGGRFQFGNFHNRNLQTHP